MTRATGWGRCRARRRTSSCSPCARRCVAGRRAVRRRTRRRPRGGPRCGRRRRARTRLQRGQHVAHRGLERRHHRARAAVGVGAVEQEQVGEIGDGHAEVGARNVAPGLGERPLRPFDLQRRDELVRLEAGREDEHVGRALTAARPDPARRDGFDRVGDERDVVACERRVPVVGEHDPLAAERVTRRDLSPQRRVVDPAPDLPPRHRLHRDQQPLVARHAVRAELVEGPDRRAVELLQHRPALERALGSLGVGEVQLRDRPARRALVDVDSRGRVRDRRHDLDRAAARPEHGHAAAGQVDVVAPAGGVERGAGEGVEPRQRRDARDRQLPAGGDQDVGGEGPALVSSVQRPSAKRAARTSVDVRTSSGRASSER